MAAPVKNELKELMAKKDAIEDEIKELTGVLETQSDIGMAGSLVDDEQYPRNDIDVYSVRHARSKIIHLQTDHQAIMKEIEAGLYKLHAQTRVDDMSSKMAEMPMESESMEVDQIPAFVKLERVDLGSPASTAGLEVNDRVIKFGSVTSENFKSLQSVGEVVQHSKGRALQVIVIRNKKELELSLTPQAWGGQGLLGCKIVPIS